MYFDVKNRGDQLFGALLVLAAVSHAEEGESGHYQHTEVTNYENELFRLWN